MKVLVIAAHPDDEVYGMGGTMAKLSDAGHEVHVLIVTDGCTAQYRNDLRLPEILAQKKEEARRANALLGVKSVHFGTLPDMRLDTVSHVEVNQLIEETVDTVAPEVVYTHFYGDVNLDHQMVYRSTLVAVRPVPGTDGAGAVLLPGTLLYGVEPAACPHRISAQYHGGYFPLYRPQGGRAAGLSDGRTPLSSPPFRPVCPGNGPDLRIAVGNGQQRGIYAAAADTLRGKTKKHEKKSLDLEPLRHQHLF